MFTTILEANDYISTKLNNDKWFNLTDADKYKYLQEATRRIKCIPMINIPNEITTDLKIACSEVAFNLIDAGAENPHAKNIQNGITSISFGNDSVSYGTGANPQSVYFTDYAMALLSQYIQKGAKIV